MISRRRMRPSPLQVSGRVVGRRLSREYVAKPTQVQNGTLVVRRCSDLRKAGKRPVELALSPLLSLVLEDREEPKPMQRIVTSKCAAKRLARASCRAGHHTKN